VGTAHPNTKPPFKLICMHPGQGEGGKKKGNKKWGGKEGGEWRCFGDFSYSSFDLAEGGETSKRRTRAFAAPKTPLI